MIVLSVVIYTFHFFFVVVILYFSPYTPVFTILVPSCVLFFCCHCTHFTYMYTTVDIHTGVRTSCW
jgi:hypothetical protein